MSSRSRAPYNALGPSCQLLPVMSFRQFLCGLHPCFLLVVDVVVVRQRRRRRNMVMQCHPTRPCRIPRCDKCNTGQMLGQNIMIHVVVMIQIRQELLHGLLDAPIGNTKRILCKGNSCSIFSYGILIPTSCCDTIRRRMMIVG